MHATIVLHNDFSNQALSEIQLGAEALMIAEGNEKSRETKWEGENSTSSQAHVILTSN